MIRMIIVFLCLFVVQLDIHAQIIPRKGLIIEVPTQQKVQYPLPVHQIYWAWSQTHKHLGRLFMAVNMLKPGVVSLNNGLQYKILKHGAGLKPSLQDNITVNYEGRLITGAVFDSTVVKGKSLTFPLSATIPGWEEALLLMQPGAIWELYIPPSLAFGEQGIPGVIGPNQTVIYIVHLVSFQKPN